MGGGASLRALYYFSAKWGKLYSNCCMYEKIFQAGSWGVIILNALNGHYEWHEHKLPAFCCVTALGTLQVLARGEALMRGEHGSFLHGYPASHTDQARLKV